MSQMGRHILDDRVERMDRPSVHGTDGRRYPTECTGSVVLADGSLAGVRAIRPEDTQRLQTFHDGLSEETVYRRFFGRHPHLRPDEAERFTHVDYRSRLGLVAEVDDRLVAVARYDRLPATDQAEVAFVVADQWQGHGLGTLLLEHLAAAGRRRGVAAFTAETLGTNHPMQEVFHQAGFPTRQNITTGIAQVHFPIAPSDTYLEAVLRRNALALHARLRPAVPSAGAGAIGIACQSNANASEVAEECRRLGVGLSAVVIAESLGADVASAIAYLAADDQTRVVLVHADLIGPPAQTVAQARSLLRRKPVLGLVAGEWSANLCVQAGVELVSDVPALVRRAVERVATLDRGTWRPPARGGLVDLDGCNVSAARDVLDDTATSGPSLEQKTVTDLLAAYAVADSDGDGRGETPAVLVTIDRDGAGSATARADGSFGRVVRVLPLTDVDAGELVGIDDPRGAEPVLRLARMFDDQPDICGIQAHLEAGGLSGVRIWSAPVRDHRDDPFVRRLPPDQVKRMEVS